MAHLRQHAAALADRAAAGDAYRASAEAMLEQLNVSMKWKVSQLSSQRIKLVLAQADRSALQAELARVQEYVALLQVPSFL